MINTTIASDQTPGLDSGSKIAHSSPLDRNDEMGGAVVLVYGFMTIYGIAIGLWLGWLIWA